MPIDPDTIQDYYVAKNGYVYWKIEGVWDTAHRHAMRAHLGRKLRPGERVHFKDGNKDNLSPENLELKQPGPRSKQGRLEHLQETFRDIWKEMYELDSEGAGKFAKDLLYETLRWH